MQSNAQMQRKMQRNANDQTPNKRMARTKKTQVKNTARSARLANVSQKHQESPGTIIFVPVGSKPSRNTDSIDNERLWTLPKRVAKQVDIHDVLVFFHGNTIRSIARPEAISYITEKQYDSMWSVPNDYGVLRHNKNLLVIKFNHVTPYKGTLTKKILMDECGYKRVIGTTVARKHSHKLLPITQYLKQCISEFY